MKLIHCADLHLDSKMSANLDKEKAKERKGEILNTFTKMVDYGIDNSVEAILISGDMFDTKNISATVRNTVLHSIATNSQIRFYYLKGNHDNDNFLSNLEEVPDNLKMFDTNWKTYEEADGKIVISGLELSKNNTRSAYVSLVLDSNKYNIVMLHGQEAEVVAKDKAEVINLKELRNRGIDYLALGHVHSYKMTELDSRGVYCYPGCLEGRGFDECGDHGFVVLDFNENTGVCTKEFISFAKRKLYVVEVDVTDCQTTIEMINRTATMIENIGCEITSLLKIVLKGMIDIECEKDLAYLLTKFKNDFYFAKVYDETTLKINFDDYIMDESLKGEYVRQIMNDELIPEEDKKIIIRYGLQALDGEEIQ